MVRETDRENLQDEVNRTIKQKKEEGKKKEKSFMQKRFDHDPGVPKALWINWNRKRPYKKPESEEESPPPPQE